MDRRTLLQIAASAGFASAAQLAPAHAQRSTSPLKVTTPAALQGVRGAVLGTFGVCFVIQRTDVARAGGGLMGSGFGGRSSARSTLVGLSDADFQAATDAAYDVFKAQLEAGGVTLHPRDGLIADLAQARVQPIQAGVERDLVYGRDDRGKARLYCPLAQGMPLMQQSWLGMITHKGMSETGGAFNAGAAFTKHARSSGHHVLSALLVVDFANAETYGGFHRNSSAVAVTSSLATWGDITQISAHAPSGRVGTAMLKDPVALAGTYGQFEDATTSAQRSAQLAANVIGVLGGIGTNSRRNYTMTANPDAWRAGVQELSSETIGTLLGALKG